MNVGSVRRGGLKKAMASDVVGIRRAIEAYVAVVESSALTAEERLAQLPAALDLLAVAVRDIRHEFDVAGYPDDPREDYQATYKVVGGHFPGLGYYNVAGSVTKEIGECKVAVGDGIDDIVDILLDLKGVLWRFDNERGRRALASESRLPVPLGSALEGLAVISVCLGQRCGGGLRSVRKT